MFEETKRECLKAKRYILPAVSYVTFILAGSYLFRDPLGNLSFVVIPIFVPLCFGMVDYFSGGNILKTFRREWSEAGVFFHVLVIIDCLILVNLYNSIKQLIWPRETSDK